MGKLLAIAITVSVSIVTFSTQTVSQQPPAGKQTAGMQIIEGPVLESVTHNSAIIRWKTNTGSSLIEHSVVHYGTDPKDLTKKAGSLNRWNRSLPYMVHRVYVMNLTPGTTYYYTVESVRGDGTPLGGRSNTTNHFTTNSRGSRQTANESGPR
jgi:Purple acid Phosphatase, N-terminal domain